MSIVKQLVLGVVFAVVFLLGRHAYYGQFEWLSGPDDAEIRAEIAKTSSVAGYEALIAHFPQDAAYLTDEIKRHIKLERRGVVSNISARKLMGEIRKRGAAHLMSAPDDLNRDVILYHARWLAAVSQDAELCERVMALGPMGVLHARLDEFADVSLRDNAMLFKAMHAGGNLANPREAPKIEEWPALYQALLHEGLAAEDLALLEQSSTYPRVCGAMGRYLERVAETEFDGADRFRAFIASSLAQL